MTIKISTSYKLPSSLVTFAKKEALRRVVTFGDTSGNLRNASGRVIGKWEAVK